jgi:hypothetical protein
MLGYMVVTMYKTVATKSAEMPDEKFIRQGFILVPQFDLRGKNFFLKLHQ